MSIQAIVIERPGPAEDVLIVQELPSLTAGPEQVLIHVTGRCIPPADFLFVAGRYRVKPTLCMGQDSKESVPSRIVVLMSPRSIQGHALLSAHLAAWADYAVAPTSRIYPVPPRVPDTVAYQLALNPFTAWGLLSERALSASSRLLVTAARSVVAHAFWRNWPGADRYRARYSYATAMAVPFCGETLGTWLRMGTASRRPCKSLSTMRELSCCARCHRGREYACTYGRARA